jgi:hypothetical protein
MSLLRVRSVTPFLILVALIGVTYLPLLGGQVLYQRDVTRHSYPEGAFLARSLAHDESLLWNPFIGLGVSSLANPLNEVFYPVSGALLPIHSPRATSIFLLAHLVLGAVGMMMLVRGLRGGVILPALVAGLGWALAGYTTSEITAGVRTVAGAYIPWCALALLYLSRTVRSGQRWQSWLRPTAVAAIPFALCFASGEIFFPIFAGVFACAVALGDTLEIPKELRPMRLRPWAWRAALASVLGLALAASSAALVLVPTLKGAHETARKVPLTRGLAEVGSFHPWRLAEMVAPGAMGDPYLEYPAGAWIGEPGLGGRPLLYGVYVGTSVLVLALLAFGRGRRLPSVLAATAAVALLAATGRHTPVHAVVRTLIPPLAYMRGPEKYLVLTQACIALLAGLGSARLVEGDSRLWRRGFAVIIALVVLIAGSSLFPAALAAQVRASAWVGLAFSVAATVLVWLTVRGRRLGGALLASVVFADLAVAVLALQNFCPADVLADESAAAKAIRADARGELAPPRAYRSERVDAAIERAAPPASLLQVERNLTRTLIDNFAGVFGIASVPGYDAALPKGLTSLWLAGRNRGLDLLRLTGVAYAILPASATTSPGIRPLLDPVPGARLYRVDGALPRVYAAKTAAVFRDAEALSAVFQPNVIAGRAVVLAPTSGAVPTATEVSGDGVSGDGVSDEGVSDEGHCQLIGYANARLEAQCRASSTIFAVFVEQWDPGWSATVDGQPAPLLRANLVMRAVLLGPGDHRVVLTFFPAGLKLGFGISVIAFLVLVLMLMAGRRTAVLQQ